MPIRTITGITQRDVHAAAVAWVLHLAAHAPNLDLTADDLEERFQEPRFQEEFERLLEERLRPIGEVVEAVESNPSDAPMLVIVDTGVGMTVADLLERLSGFAGDRERFHGLVDALMPTEPIPSGPVLEQARSNAAARVAFLEEFPTLSSSEVADLYGSGARNRAALAQGWRKQQRVFAVPTSSGLRFPLFQFSSHGQPKPQLAPILRLLDDAGIRGWEVALWFTSTSASLDGARPVDLLDDQPGRVEAAAAQLNEIPY